MSILGFQKFFLLRQLGWGTALSLKSGEKQLLVSSFSVPSTVIITNSAQEDQFQKQFITGLYLWEHIMGGILYDEQGKLVKQGRLHHKGVEFR